MRRELETVDSESHTLLTMQLIEINIPNSPYTLSGNTLLHTGSKINLICDGFTKKLWWKGMQVTQYLQVTGKPVEGWETCAFKIPPRKRSGGE